MAYIEILTPQKFTNSDGLIQLPDVSSGLLVDLDADTLTGAPGSEVTSWQSGGQSPITLTETVTGQSYPTLAPDSLSGHNTVTFGGNHSLATETGGPELLAAGQDATIMAIARTTNLTGEQRIISPLTVPTWRFMAFRIGAAAISTKGVGAAGATLLTVPNAHPLDEWTIIVARWQGETMRLNTSDGQSVEEQAPSGALTDVVLGSRNSTTGVNPLSGGIAAVKIYNRALSDVDVAGLMEMMATKYGLGA